jgi:hypothetical protein
MPDAFPEKCRKASRLLSTAKWLVKPLQQRSENAGTVIESRATGPALCGCSHPMPLCLDAETNTWS